MSLIKKIKRFRAKRFEKKYELISGVDAVKIDDGYGGKIMYPIYNLEKVRRKRLKRERIE